MSRTDIEIFESGEDIWQVSSKYGVASLATRPYWYNPAPIYSYNGMFYSKAALELHFNSSNKTYDEETLKQYRISGLA